MCERLPDLTHPCSRGLQQYHTTYIFSSLSQKDHVNIRRSRQQTDVNAVRQFIQAAAQTNPKR